MPKTNAKQFESNRALKKEKHRWYHWIVLILFVFSAGFNLVESSLISGAEARLLTYNVQQLLSGGGRSVSFPRVSRFPEMTR